ncbi:hypothetical protein ERICIV_00860 [Paenibacillus larvae subsp. larvae]|uniref:Uncharacterized protein n=1 Tax=Paenibacillus larvae subsp. larvae TaxID=147375 RepID=A0A2L1U2M5_9BACL|nr:hypothetical protein ERICIII_00857 [Paenibacillus larvae subsp. larvae]AVF27118.1 hypothetical protein ERICIII_02991 [Paenibacillus larvae subsp. larvae]AVF29828.1 hypothetical protein ERICIV_00860 [Paenibacillus larvae subsp. larvae]
MIDNGMTRPYYTHELPVVTEDWPTCDCGSRAYLLIEGNLRCLDCAADEGVELLKRR